MSDGDTGKDARALAEFVAARGAAAELVRPGTRMPTVPLAAAALGVHPAQIVKSIVFQHKKDHGRVCLVIAPGDARVHPAKVARALGMTQLKLASPAVALEATGYAVGGIPPIGHPQVPVVLDRSVLAHEIVFGGGGDEEHMLRIAPSEIAHLTAAVLADVLVDGQP